MTVDTVQCEMWLMRWSEDSKGGAKIVMQIHAEDLEPFKSLTLAKGKTAGQRFMAVLALIADDEKPDNLPAGPLCKLAAIWCRESAFQAWAERVWPSLWAEYDPRAGVPREGAAKGVICRVCGVESRKELDHNAEARRAFTELIRRPYMGHLSEAA